MDGRQLASLKIVFSAENTDGTSIGSYRIESSRAPIVTPKIVVATGGLSIPQPGASDLG